MPVRIDLNADVGEFSRGDPAGQDELLMRAITSANIACGFHAGDASVIRDTVRLAQHAGVAVGAHPSLADRAGFGRRELPVGAAEVENLVAYQIGVVAALAAVEGIRLTHVKPHGALYNMAARDRPLAAAVAAAVKQVDRSLILYGLAGSELLAAADDAGMASAAEVFADRAYLRDGSLLPRSQPGALISDPALVVSRALDMVVRREVTAVDGTRIPLRADTLCVHGDTPGAAQLALQLRAALESAGVEVCAAGAR